MGGKRLTLVRNLTAVTTVDELREQLGDIFSRLEDYLGEQINVHFLLSTDKLPILNQGDLVFTAYPNGVATLQQWKDGHLVTISLAGPPGADGADGTDGTDGADGVGVPPGGTAGQSLVKIDGTDFNTTWATITGGGGSEPLSDGNLPNPEIVFDDITGDVVMVG